DGRYYFGGGYPAEVFRVGNQRFLSINLADQGLAIYRFNPTVDGEVAIPCALFANYWHYDWPATKPLPASAAGGWIWVDTDGDAQMDAEPFIDTNGNGVHDADESFTDTNGNSMYDTEYFGVTTQRELYFSNHVDANGNVWKSYAAQDNQYAVRK